MLRLERTATCVTYLVASVFRPACVPSAFYLAVLLVLLQGSHTVYSSARLVLFQSLVQLVSSTAFLALSVSLATPGGSDEAPWPSTWWPDLFVLIVSLATTFFSLRAVMSGVTATGGPMLTVSALTAAWEGPMRFDATEIGLSVVAVCILATACVVHPCVLAIPMEVVVLAALGAWGWGSTGRSLIKWVRRAQRVAQLYAAVWVAAFYGAQLAANMGSPPDGTMKQLGLFAVPWLAPFDDPSTASRYCSEMYCADLAETQATLLIVFLFWAHFVGLDAAWIRQCLCPWQAEGALTARESLSQSLLRGEAPSPAASTWGGAHMHVLPATASVNISSPPSPPPPPSPPLEPPSSGVASSGVGGILPRRLGPSGSPAVASGAACCGSILLVVLALLTPSAVTLVCLFFGAAGLLSIPSWPFAEKYAATPLSTSASPHPTLIPISPLIPSPTLPHRAGPPSVGAGNLWTGAARFSSVSSAKAVAAR